MKKLIDECICNEYDGKGLSTCGFPCPIHKSKNARDNRIHKEGFNAGYKKGRKDLIREIKEEFNKRHIWLQSGSPQTLTLEAYNNGVGFDSCLKEVKKVLEDLTDR